MEKNVNVIERNHHKMCNIKYFTFTKHSTYGYRLGNRYKYMYLLEIAIGANPLRHCFCMNGTF